MKIEDLKPYQTFVFDCDGVLLNSNKVKTEAFFQVAKQFGDDAAQEFVDYHVAKGGVSRYLKFEYFLTEILDRELDDAVLQSLLTQFADEVKRGLLQCEVASGLEELRTATPFANWMVVSGGDQSELREVFKLRDLDRFFNSGIFGSPDTKEAILDRELSEGNLQSPGIFFGDSRYDFEASRHAELDFLFISGWSEFKGWQSFCDQNQIAAVSSLDRLLAV